MTTAWPVRLTECPRENPTSGHDAMMLRTIPVAFISSIVPSRINFLAAQAKGVPSTSAPFSRFVDVAETAGLTQTVVYGQMST